MRPTLWELDSQTEKGGNLFISVYLSRKALKLTYSTVLGILENYLPATSVPSEVKNIKCQVLNWPEILLSRKWSVFVRMFSAT